MIGSNYREWARPGVTVKALMLLLLASLSVRAVSAETAVLPSWQEGASRTAIIEFVNKVSDEGSADYVPPAQRIAVFDNDGTLWAEQPMYFQAIFAFDRVKALSNKNPQWKAQEPFAAVLRGDVKAALAGGMPALMEIIMAAHGDITVSEFENVVTQWLETAKHPTKNRKYTEMVYQPMLELLGYLRDNGFTTWIVSGGGIEFMRPWVEGVYGIPPEQVVGSSVKTAYEIRDGVPVLARLNEIDFVDDKEGKPVGINRHIGQRPIMAVGNSDGDFQMLEWSTAGDGARLGVLIHHTDARREWAYDRESHIGQLVRGLDEGPERGWLVVDMAKDWSQVFPPLASP